MTFKGIISYQITTMIACIKNNKHTISSDGNDNGNTSKNTHKKFQVLGTRRNRHQWLDKN